mmetsp:Transcript_4976/g.7547  ORF Transcript_4976/g.7547 Transcript_4976/m.7547 type:complete len:219 (+) Transcript_4976:62-718(+)|eukprot:CAMPEP_0113941474 /NCGR_PEP_ID=MMETSP1339-20121228/7374_1 /TAXON_ID=94617 /ORGANISM="Fibrocapsa japonica" /LENGTH=218 /DNA_ID=CAMNT_0000945625 /DNA_START=36 /DNA_END=692 /DNA_ORIENTATION=+ /assembly_acc=CAM_ASM_000762
MGLLSKSFAALCIASISCVTSLQLYGSQGSRSPLVNWYCHEINLPFEVVNPRGLFKKNPHPFGQIPCLDDDGQTVFESGAILMYLADKYGGLDTPEKRSSCNQWVTWANSCLDPILFKENERGGVIGTGAGEENKRLRALDTILGDKEYILEQFSVADVAIASYLLYIPQFFGPKINFGARYPNIANYMKRCASREAYRKAYPQETDTILAICETYFG